MEERRFSDEQVIRKLRENDTDCVAVLANARQLIDIPRRDRRSQVLGALAGGLVSIVGMA